MKINKIKLAFIITTFLSSFNLIMANDDLCSKIDTLIIYLTYTTRLDPNILDQKLLEAQDLLNKINCDSIYQKHAFKLTQQLQLTTISKGNPNFSTLKNLYSTNLLSCLFDLRKNICYDSISNKHILNSLLPLHIILHNQYQDLLNCQYELIKKIDSNNNYKHLDKNQSCNFELILKKIYSKDSLIDSNINNINQKIDTNLPKLDTIYKKTDSIYNRTNPIETNYIFGGAIYTQNNISSIIKYNFEQIDDFKVLFGLSLYSQNRISCDLGALYNEKFLLSFGSRFDSEVGLFNVLFAVKTPQNFFIGSNYSGLTGLGICFMYGF